MFFNKFLKVKNFFSAGELVKTRGVLLQIR